MRPDPTDRCLPAAPRQAGFTLVEMVMALVVFGLMAATLTVFLRPALEAYLSSRARAELTAQGDSALRRMVQDVQSAVPNSIRAPSTGCIELVPTSAGGRFRKGPDTVNGGAVALDNSAATTSFDVLTPLPTTPAIGDWVVVDNQNAGDVYSGVNRAAITSVSTPAASAGRHRLGVVSTQFPLGYDGGRFVVVPASQQAVFYYCIGADGSEDANGNGRGSLHRSRNYGFNAGYPATCPTTAGDVLASAVKSCRFVYDPNQGATQQNGFVSIQLELSRRGDSVSLVVGAHVANVP